jgi:hypothetical protein
VRREELRPLRLAGPPRFEGLAFLDRLDERRFEGLVFFDRLDELRVPEREEDPLLLLLAMLSSRLLRLSL